MEQKINLNIKYNSINFILFYSFENGIKSKQKKEYMSDLPLSELPPVEKLTISVPEEECQEIGTISSVVDTLGIVNMKQRTEDIHTYL